MTGPRFIDMTPTWTETVQICTAVLENGTEEGRKAAREELHRMASILDQLVKDKKAQEEKAKL